MNDEEKFNAEIAALIHRPLSDDELMIAADCYLLGYTAEQAAEIVSTP